MPDWVILADIDWDRVEPHNQAGRAAGEAVDSLTLTRSLNQLHRMTRDIVARFDREFDLFVTPTLTIEPPAVGLLEAVHREGDPVMEVVAMAAYTAVFNITGQPAVSLPCTWPPRACRWVCRSSPGPGGRPS